jgi:hypothetical protein
MALDSPFRKLLTGVSTFLNPTIPSDALAAFSSVRFCNSYQLYSAAGKSSGEAASAIA